MVRLSGKAPNVRISQDELASRRRRISCRVVGISISGLKVHYLDQIMDSYKVTKGTPSRAEMHSSGNMERIGEVSGTLFCS
jgi:hypothetical protein